MFSERVIKGTIIVATASLSLWLAASGTTSLMAARLLKPAPAPRKQSAPALPSEQQSALAIGESVLARNIFDSQSGGMPWQIAPVEVVPPVGSTPPDKVDELVECEGTMRLVASVVSRDPALSRSTIEQAGNRRLVAVGTQLDEDREIYAIGTQRVLLRNRASNVCSLSMFKPAVSQVAAAPAAAPAPEAAAPVASAATEANATASELEAGITKISDTKYRVSRVSMDKTLANPTAMMRFARGVPHTENGRNVGMRLTSVRATSPLRKLGILPNDVVRSINGFDLSTPDGALEAYSKLRTQQALSISISRDGKPVTIEISIE